MKNKIITRKKIQRCAQYYVYMVQCQTGAYYTGFTNNLNRRIAEHNSGKGAKYLKGKGPVECVYSKEYRYYKSALRRERELKRFSRPQKEKLIKQYMRLKSLHKKSRAYEKKTVIL